MKNQKVEFQKPTFPNWDIHHYMPGDDDEDGSNTVEEPDGDDK